MNGPEGTLDASLNAPPLLHHWFLLQSNALSTVPSIMFISTDYDINALNDGLRINLCEFRCSLSSTWDPAVVHPLRAGEGRLDAADRNDRFTVLDPLSQCLQSHASSEPEPEPLSESTSQANLAPTVCNRHHHMPHPGSRYATTNPLTIIAAIGPPWSPTTPISRLRYRT